MSTYLVKFRRHDGTPIGEATVTADTWEEAVAAARYEVPFTRYAVAFGERVQS